MLTKCPECDLQVSDKAIYTDRDFEWLKEEIEKIVCKKKSPC